LTVDDGRTNAFLAAEKRSLKVERLVLQIHDASFPADPDEETGRASPYSYGAERFFQFAAGQGFDTIQLGPQGMTSRGNASPYDSTIFSRNPLNLPLRKFFERGRLSRTTWEAIRRKATANTPQDVSHEQAFDSCRLAVGEIIASASSIDRAQANHFLAIHEGWLVPDALYGVLSREHGSESWYDWDRTPQGAFDQRLYDPPAGSEQEAADRMERLRETFREEIENYALIQWLLDEEHRALRARLADLRLALYGDLQVGLSLRDAWAWRKLFLAGYRMGAPPSRTTPSGQPWGYAVFDPAQLGTPQSPGPALRFVRSRVARMLAEFDGVRIDHPHGWIDPWVYRIDEADPHLAVQSGARLFSTPNDLRHPELRDYAIARPDQIDRLQTLFADGHVTDLDDEQVGRYSLLLDEIVTQQTAIGRKADAIACEVLSTLPYPVSRVMKRHGLGRFRVTQKMDFNNPADVYRIENAQPEDWIMPGTHDTPPIWRLAHDWCAGSQGAVWGRYLAERLVPVAERPSLAARIAEHPGELVNACVTALLASRARNVAMFFPDLFGITQRYNEPGLVSDDNWSLRVPANFEEFLKERIEQGMALDLRSCFARAMGVVRE
jgi:4-alpha-glucanotransferase